MGGADRLKAYHKSMAGSEEGVSLPLTLFKRTAKKMQAELQRQNEVDGATPLSKMCGGITLIAQLVQVRAIIEIERRDTH